MKKWRKRLLWSFVTLLVLILAGGGVMYYVSKQHPDWYRSKKLSAAQLLANRRSAEDKLTHMQNWVQGQRQVSTTRPRVDTDPTTAPSDTWELSLSEDELNALLDNFEKLLLERYGQYISDPYLAIREERLILAVTIKDANRVLSVYINPKLDDKGMLILEIDKLKAGRLPVPGALWSSYTDKLAELLQPTAKKTDGNSRMEADGTASSDAVTVERTRLLLNSLKGRGSNAVLFLPAEPSHWEVGYPAKVMDIKLDDQKLTLKLSKLTKAEQDQLIQRIRAPFGEEPDPAITGPIPVKTEE
jgi:hypothetical protein